MLLLFVLAQATYYGSGVPPPLPPPGSPKPGIFSYDDYPPEALRNGWEGTVQAELTVNEQGAVEICRIIQSSGHEVLDAATCGLIIRRARFTPAKDESGKPIKDTVTSPPINWRIR
jgi:periplasmic protein TonB